MKKYQKQWCLNNIEKLKKDKKQWYRDNVEELKKRFKQWRVNNPERKKELDRQYYIDNKEKIKNRVKVYHYKKLKEDIRYNLNQKMATAIWHMLKKNKKERRWEILVGYTCNDLIKRLKHTMPKNYTWQNFLEGKLHIDHIIPKSVFNFTKPEHIDFKRCWALSNLQLLPARENRIKHDKLNEPFQPTLQLEGVL